MLNIINLC